MESIKNFLQFIYANWMDILVCIALIVGIIQKTKSYLSKSKEERVEIAKTQIRQTMLKLVTQAEVDYDSWNQAGSIKRSQVIKQIFDEYPILSTVANQQEVIRWIESEIESSLSTLDDIITNSNSETNDSKNDI